jgi:uncharacterized protein (TIGR04255 family)
MNATLPDAPFGDEPLPDYKLSHAPLKRVIVQIKFPRSTELIADQQTILDIARGLAAEYPAFADGTETEFEFSPGGPKMKNSPTWHFTSYSESDSVVVTPTSIAFDTSAYISRDAMLDKLGRVFRATIPHVRPAYIERVGARYTNRLGNEEASERAKEFFKEPLLAGLSVPVGVATVAQTLTHTVYTRSPDVSMSVRSGLVPAGVQLDPGHEPSADETFLLDLDAFRGRKQQEVDIESLLAQVSALAEIVYRFFLWSLTSEGLAAFGGKDTADE